MRLKEFVDDSSHHTNSAAKTSLKIKSSLRINSDNILISPLKIQIILDYYPFAGNFQHLGKNFLYFI